MWMILSSREMMNQRSNVLRIRKELEVKDLGQLRYFLGIEIARSPKGIVLSQRKYVLDLLSETGMLGCRPASTPIDPNHKLCPESGDPVNKERYQRLVGRLIYLCHTRPDISYAVSVVSRYMHDPRSGHLEAVKRILRYLKGSPGKGLMFKSHGHLNVDGYAMQIGQVVLMIGDQHQVTVCLLGGIWFHGEVRNNQLCHGLLLKLNTEQWHKGCVRSYG
jgi:hypothetical protein